MAFQAFLSEDQPKKTPQLRRGPHQKCPHHRYRLPHRSDRQQALLKSLLPLAKAPNHLLLTAFCTQNSHRPHCAFSLCSRDQYNFLPVERCRLPPVQPQASRRCSLTQSREQSADLSASFAGLCLEISTCARVRGTGHGWRSQSASAACSTSSSWARKSAASRTPPGAGKRAATPLSRASASRAHTGSLSLAPRFLLWLAARTSRNSFIGTNHFLAFLTFFLHRLPWPFFPATFARMFLHPFAVARPPMFPDTV